MVDRVIIFLGNPGDEYAHTRHNLAWQVADELAAGAQVGFQPDQPDFLSAKARIAAKRVLLVKPLTYMNLIGRILPPLAKREKTDARGFLVIADDIDLPLGRIRIRREGSSGGHRGIESIIQYLDTQAFTRVRLGVGPVPEGVEASEFVLDRFTADELIVAQQVAARAADAVRLILSRGVAAAANNYNRKPPAPDSLDTGTGADRPGESQ